METDKAEPMLPLLSEEGPHSPGPENEWQESIVVVWQDKATAYCGIHRIGVEPNTHTSNLWCAVWGPSGTYWHNAGGLPYAPLPNGFQAGEQSLTIEGEKLCLRVEAPSFRLDLYIEDFYGPRPFGATSAGEIKDIAKFHLEASGRVQGLLQIDGEQHRINGLMHRDHSCGVRHWDAFPSYRWAAGTFGPELSFSGLCVQDRQGNVYREGFVVENGRHRNASDFDALVHLESDGFAHRGGSAIWTFPEGDKLEIKIDYQNGAMFETRGFFSFDAICKVSGAGHSGGFCDFGASSNPRQGLERPHLLSPVPSGPGFFRR
jgi:hypothetical protein